MAASRASRYSLIFALPLFLLYEGLASTLSGSAGTTAVRNAADVALKTPFLLLSGARGSLVFFATVIAACVFLVGRDLARSRERLKPRTFLMMLGESALLALLRGPHLGSRGYYKVGLRHGVSTVTCGRRTALGIIFHDAR